MKTQTIITLLVIILVFVGLFFFGYAQKGGPVTAGPTAGPSMALNTLVASEMIYDFGTISMKDGKATADFTVTNPTNKDIIVRSIETSCMCTNAFIVEADGSTKGPFGMPGHGGAVPPANETIKAGESRVIRVVYDPNAHGPAGVGAIDRFVTLTDADGQTLQLEIKANVTP